MSQRLLRLQAVELPNLNRLTYSHNRRKASYLVERLNKIFEERHHQDDFQRLMNNKSSKN